RDVCGKCQSMKGDRPIRRLRAREARRQSDRDHEQQHSNDADHVADLPARWLRLIAARACGLRTRGRSCPERSRERGCDQAFIDSKNSELLLVLRSLSSRKSMASIVPIGFKMRRRMYIFLS